jgi:hypothetical protein
VTIAYLKEYLGDRKVPPPFARATWATTRILVNELNQTRITDF